MQNDGGGAAAELAHAVLFQPALLKAIWAHLGSDGVNCLCSGEPRVVRLVCKRRRDLGDAAVSRVNTRAGASAEELRSALARWRGVGELQFRLMQHDDALLLLELSGASLPRLRYLTIYQVGVPPSSPMRSAT